MVEIRRFGNYIATVEEKALEGWLRDNLSYNVGDMVIPSTWSFEWVVTRAKMLNYTFIKL